MAGNTNDFEARIAHLNAKGTHQETTSSTKRPVRRGVIVSAILGSCALVAVGIAVTIMVPKLNAMTEMISVASATSKPNQEPAMSPIANEVVEPLKVESKPKAQPRIATNIDIGQHAKPVTKTIKPKRVTAKKTEPTKPTKSLTLAHKYFPAAPLGWVVVTPEDSPTKMGSGGSKAEKEKVKRDHAQAVEDGINRVAARWPGGREAMEAHTRYRELKGMISGLPLLRAVIGELTNKSKVIYFDPKSNAYLKAEIQFLPKHQRLGSKDDKASWGTEIVNRLSKRYGSKGVPTQFLEFSGGVAYLDTTSLTRVEFVSMGSNLENYGMVIALNHRTQLEILGQMKPEQIKAFLRGFDFDALEKRAEAMD